MNAFLARIIIFGDNQEKREVPLGAGLNIITGDSKTGKSALLEIVDYCLFSSRSTIPKGVIENFATLYSIVIQAAEKYIVIARPSTKTGLSGKAYVKVETSDQFLESLSKQYFLNIDTKLLKDAQIEVERHLGLSVLDTRLNDEEDKQKSGGKASLRSFVPFLFQHQNLIANKHSIFYRFEDFYKRKKTIDDFPILIGWEDSEYFLYHRELEEKQKELKAQEKLAKSLKLKDEQLQIQLRSIIESYFNLIGLELESNLSLAELKKISKKLPAIGVNSYADLNLANKIEVKEIERQELTVQLNEVQEMLQLLEKNSSLTYGNVERLKFLDMTSSIESGIDSIVCPVCNNKNDHLNSEIIAINQSREALKIELSKINVYRNDNSQQIEELQKKRNSLKRQISKLTSEITGIEEHNKALKNKKALRDQAFIAKGMAEANIKNLFNSSGQNPFRSDTEELQTRIEWLKSKIDGIDLKSKIVDANSFLSQKMTEICQRLDFEKELRPGVLRFSLEDFVFYYHFDEKEKIHLSEMGSGANWLACHLSLFIALLHLNCREKKSIIPSFLFIDQPSQVYFPTQYGIIDDDKGNDSDENIRQVKNIFTVIIDALETIKTDCGFLPQIVVMEHADEPEFDQYVKARWKKDGKKLI